MLFESVSIQSCIETALVDCFAGEKRIPQAPQFAPEVSIQVALLNFSATPDAVQEQLLGQAVKLERPKLWAQSAQLVREEAANKRELKELEDRSFIYHAR